MKPSVQEIIIQSDNATWISSQEIVSFLFHLNAVSTRPKIKRWIFTESQTVRGILDTHVSYTNVVMKSYVQNENYIYVEEDIFKSLWFQVGNVGTTSMLLDAWQLQGPIISNPLKAKRGIGYSCSLTRIHPEIIKVSMRPLFLSFTRWEEEIVLIIHIYGARSIFLLFSFRQETKSE